MCQEKVEWYLTPNALNTSQFHTNLAITLKYI